MPATRPLALSAALVAGVVLAAGATAAGAHDTWLLPARATVPSGVDATFDLTSGMTFPANETAVAAARVRTARVRTAGGSIALPTPVAGTRALRFRVPLRRAGVATVWVSLAPRALTLDSAGVMHYLDEIGAPDSVRVAYLRQLPIDGVRRWRERYAKHATTHVLVSSPLRPRPSADASWSAPTGMPLELVPLRDPTALHAGDSVAVRLLVRGRPLPHTAVGAVGPDGHAHPPRRTDAEGRVTIPLPRAGRWLLRATHLRHTTAPDLDWESEFATLTLAVR
ncbi:MAG: DUF4198 domain-containing protein [Gemmatirosa sp.]